MSTVELTEKKKDHLKKLLEVFSPSRECKIRDSGRFIGVFLVSCYPAVAYSSIYCKRLEREKYLALIMSSNNYEKMIISSSLEEVFEWWKEAIKVGKNPIRRENYKIEINSDALLSG